MIGKHDAPQDVPQELVCWTRMQSEAGQKLEEIVARKEMERRAGNGVFFWGVGNAPAVVASAYARLQVPVQVIFSIMKGRPRSVDAAPRSILVWRSYLDMFGVERDLPQHALITSRGETDKGDKRRHYALICSSSTPLRLEHGVNFDPTAYRNAGGNGGLVGASQVTALLQRVAPPMSGDYEVNLTASLSGSYWVKLTNPVVLEASDVEQAANAASSREWCSLVVGLRRSGQPIAPSELQSSFF